MCGRYLFLDYTAAEIERELGLPKGFFAMKYFGERIPGVRSGALCMHHEQLSLDELMWGIPGRNGKPIINARSETVLEKPMFRESVRTHRCILPASAFYEWDAQKQKVTFYNVDRCPIYLAGFYDPHQDGHPFVILTREANSSMRDVHDRMPLILEKEEVYDWVNRNDLVELLLKKETGKLEKEQNYEQLSLL